MGLARTQGGGVAWAVVIWAAPPSIDRRHTTHTHPSYIYTHRMSISKRQLFRGIKTQKRVSHVGRHCTPPNPQQPPATATAPTCEGVSAEQHQHLQLGSGDYMQTTQPLKKRRGIFLKACRNLCLSIL
jgi:hypothetical protein